MTDAAPPPGRDEPPRPHVDPAHPLPKRASPQQDLSASAPDMPSHRLSQPGPITLRLDKLPEGSIERERRRDARRWRGSRPDAARVAIVDERAAGEDVDDG